MGLIKDKYNDFLWAQRYVDYGIKEGFLEPEDWEDLSMEEYIKRATADNNEREYRESYRN